MASDFPATTSELDWAQARFKQLNAAVGSCRHIDRLSPAALAYIGDAVFELYIRSCYLLPPKRLQSYHQQVVAHVRAESQARYLLALLPHLTSTEKELVTRGRNAAGASPKRLEPEIYQQATSFETLIGYLYLTDSQRLTELLVLLPID